MRLILTTLLLLGASFASKGQTVIRFNFGEPATVVSFVKEVMVWQDGKKISHDSYAGDKMEIYLSDSLIRVTEKDTTHEYPIKEVRVDDFRNVSFLADNGTVLRWHRQQRLFQIEPSESTKEIVYYVE